MSCTNCDCVGDDAEPFVCTPTGPVYLIQDVEVTVEPVIIEEC